MPVTYTLRVHERRGATRHIEIEIGPREPDAEPVIEVFDWGMDVPMKQVRAETIALLDAKYVPDIESLPGVGAPFER